MQENGEPSQVAVIMVDIDFFKQFNDTYGHVAGDEALRAVSAALKRCMRRPGDMVARFGGEEFACILPDTDLAGARKVAEQMRRRIEWLDIAHEKSAIGSILTASIGISAGAGTAESELVRLADDALYDAKHQGRNRVCEREPKAQTAQLATAA
jgi:diguanylate cyclase (GGDEF)-like protein